MQTSGKMPSVPAGDQGGFVPATDVMTEMIRVGASAAANADDATASSAGAAPAAAGLVAAVPGGPRAMRWNNNTSGFILRRMAQLLSDGSRPDKVFKDKDVNSVAKALKEYSGEAVSPTQVYNHLRKWWQKWSRVSKLKDLSGALWDSDSNAILLDQEHYLGHCKVAL